MITVHDSMSMAARMLVVRATSQSLVKISDSTRAMAAGTAAPIRTWRGPGARGRRRWMMVPRTGSRSPRRKRYGDDDDERDELADAGAGQPFRPPAAFGELHHAGLEHAEDEAADHGERDRGQAAEQRRTERGDDELGVARRIERAAADEQHGRRCRRGTPTTPS